MGPRSTSVSLGVSLHRATACLSFFDNSVLAQSVILVPSVNQETRTGGCFYFLFRVLLLLLGSAVTIVPDQVRIGC